MKPSLRLVTLPVAGAMLVSALSLVLTGCGLGTTQAVTGATGATKTAALSGKVHGGPNAVANANVVLWETWTTGIDGSATGRTPASSSNYGSAAFQVGNTTTDTAGSWNIASFNCDNGEYLYVTVTGGKTASNTANSGEVLTAPLGACTTLPATVNLNVSELSTVAMAYALGAFTSENPTYVGTGTQQVWIGSPAANNAVSGACTGAGVTLACTATGLGQAFTTAISLVNSVSYTGTPTGAANTTLMDASGLVANTSSSVPQALINTLGNILQSCVNTSGGTAGDSSACGNLYTDSSTATVTPSDTLQAAINIARFPGSNVGALYALGGPLGAFTPALTAQPNDFSLAITFAGPNTATAFDPPQYVVLKPTEDVVVLTTNSGATTDTLFDLSPNGLVNASAAQTSSPGERQLAVDLSGNIFANLPATSGSVNEYSPFSLALSHQYAFNAPGGLAVDRSNTVYWTQASTSSASIYSLAPLSTTPAQITIASSPAPTVATGTSTPGALSFDSSQNLWLNMLGGSNQQINYVYDEFVSPNTCTAPDFCGVNGGNLGITVGDSYSTVFDGSGFVYSNAGGRVYKFDESENEIGFYSLALGHTIKYASIDGAGVIFYTDATNGFLYPFLTSVGTWASLQPCSLRINGSAAQTTSCVNALSSPANTQVDAAGAVWIADPGSKLVVKLLGVGSPAWPSLALAHPAVEPQ